MPTVKKLQDVEMSVEDIIADLMEHAQKAQQPGVFLVNPDGSNGDPIQDGDVLMLKPELYAQSNIADGTPVLVMKTLPEAAIFWGCAIDKAGNVSNQFYNGTPFETQKHAVRGASAERAPAGRRTAPGRR